MPCFPCQSFVLFRVVINLLKNQLALTLSSQIHDGYCWPCLSDSAGGEVWEQAFCLFIMRNAAVTWCSAEAAALSYLSKTGLSHLTVQSIFRFIIK